VELKLRNFCSDYREREREREREMVMNFKRKTVPDELE
jgi:hypothetical protein